MILEFLWCGVCVVVRYVVTFRVTSRYYYQAGDESPCGNSAGGGESREDLPLITDLQTRRVPYSR